ncbi:MAG: hypothetical protein ACR2LS_04235 [Thermomicrobiales bacterium]
MIMEFGSNGGYASVAARQFVMRFTVVDERGALSFVAPAHLMKAFTAACAQGANDALALLTHAAAWDHQAVAAIRRDLHVFDEHHTASEPEQIDTWLKSTPKARPFRVLNSQSRRISLEPAGAGLVVFNLVKRRIVQVQNSFAELRRRDRGRIRRDGKPTPELYRYELPPDWAILP